MFATYQLTTNYRSNQEVLDFANVALDDIEANLIAKIQLQANSHAVPTEKSFREAVTLDYTQVKAKKNYIEALPTRLRDPHSEIHQWIDKRVQAGETVAFIAYSRSEVKLFEEVMTELYPTKHIANLVSDKVYDTNAFSAFIKKYWNDVRVAGYQSAARIAAVQIFNTLDIRNKNPKQTQAIQLGVRKMIDGWWRGISAEEGLWKQMVQNGQITEDQYFENLQDSMLAFEINHNSIRQRVIGMQNKDRKQADMDGQPDIIVSTVHGVKGLEFPHVVVLHNYDNQMAEDMKRLYYVAFTRARESELVLSHGSVKNAKIEADYISLVEALVERDDRAKLASQGVDLDTMAEDDVTAALAAMRDVRQKEADKAAEALATELNAQAIAEQGDAPSDPTKATMALVGAAGSGGGQDSDDDTVNDGSAFTA